MVQLAKRFQRSMVLGGLLTSLLMATSASSALATNYFVSSSAGSDSNNGTSPTSPWRSLSKVNAFAFAAGDQIEFSRGDIWTGGLTVARSGTNAARISYLGYGPSLNRPKITGGLSGDCIKVTASFITIDNLWGAGCGYAGVQVYGTDTTVKNSMFSGNAVGIHDASSATANVLIDNNVLTNNNVLNVNNGSGSSGAFGILLNGPAVVTNNTVSGSHATSIAYGYDGSGIELYNAHNSWVHHNTFVDNDTGIEMGGTGSGNAFEYNKVTGNLGAADPQTNGIVLPGSVSGEWISHNSIDELGASSQGIVCFSSCAANDTITSNAVKATTKALYVDVAPTVQGNVFNGQVQGVTLDATNSTAPILWAAPPGDLTEQPSSPTVDHATVTNFASDLAGHPVPDIAGTASDSGAYELQSRGGGDTTPPSTPTGLTVSNPTQTGLTLSWAASTDNVGVTGYGTFLNGAANGNVTTTSKAFSGLACGTAYTLGTQAFDAAGNRSALATAQGATSACPQGGAIQHVVVIVMENHDASVLSQMPYLNGLASTYGQATNYYAIGHFSADNYIAMTSGTTCCFDDSFQNLSGRQNIFGQLGAAAQTLAERGGGGYAQRHDPGAYYGFSSLGYTDGQNTDLSGKKFTFVVPGLCDDMHDCGPSTGDAWLSRNVPKFQANPNTAIFITFDEDSGGGQGTTTPPSNHVPMVVVSPFTSHVSDGTQFNHYSLLRTVEGIFGVPLSGSAGSATSMAGHFGF